MARLAVCHIQELSHFNLNGQVAAPSRMLRDQSIRSTKGAVFIFLPSPLRNFNAGFGPERECTPQAKGEPTCIKKIGRQN